MQGNFVEIGVNFYMYNDSVAVIKPVENGPSAKAGIKAETVFCMLIKRNYLGVNCQVIVCFLN
jgi:C-terminal processing protease CtpA/Prc